MWHTKEKLGIFIDVGGTLRTVSVDSLTVLSIIIKALSNGVVRGKRIIAPQLNQLLETFSGKNCLNGLGF